ncbi:MAG: DegT/DnrJ/EryC1/StrS family aminotransferase [Planctomycetota bacterium]
MSTEERVPMANLAAQCAPLEAQIRGAIDGVLKSQRFIHGPEVLAFEQEAAAHLGVRHAVGCASGSDALYLALRALGIRPGDEVITSPLTYVATPEAVTRCGAQVVFCDVDPVTWTLDPEQVAERITARTRAILPVHIFGQCADMTALRQVAGSLPIVEDASQAWGAEHHGQKAGSLGTLACFSFFPTKNLGAFGDGGLITTDDDELDRSLRRLRAHGQVERYKSSTHGLNSRLDAIQAAVLRVKLGHVDHWNAGRREVVEGYRRRLTGSAVSVPCVAEGNLHVWCQCVLLTDRRDELSQHLHTRGVDSAVYYVVPQHLQVCYQELGHRRKDFPVAEDVCRRGLAIPCWPEMTARQRQQVADSVLEFCGPRAELGEQGRALA